MKRYIVTLILLLLLTGAVMAQDTTAEPAATHEAAATAEATQTADETTQATENEEKPVVPANLAGTVLLILIPILSVAFGGGGILAMVIAFRKDRAAVSASEQLGNSIPQPVAERMLTIIDAMTAGLQAGREALDRVPATEKPAAFNDFTTDALILELEQRGYVVTARAGG